MHQQFLVPPRHLPTKGSCRVRLSINGRRSKHNLRKNQNCQQDGFESKVVVLVKFITSIRRPSSPPSSFQRIHCPKVGQSSSQNPLERSTISMHERRCRPLRARLSDATNIYRGTPSRRVLGMATHVSYCSGGMGRQK